MVSNYTLVTDKAILAQHSPRIKWRHWDMRWTRRYLISVFTVILFSLLTIFVGQHLFSFKNTKLPAPQFQEIDRSVKTWYDSDLSVEILNITAEILNLLEQQRKLIRKELAGGKIVHPDFYEDLNDEDYFKKFVPENGGTPIRSVVVSTWRSGTTFVGDLLNSVPGNYYHYEPLLDYDIIQIRGPPLAEQALQILKNLLRCNYTSLDKYLTYGSTHQWLFTHNVRLWNLCSQKKEVCWMPEFLNPACKLFPFQSMKVIRLRLSLIEDLLVDDSLNLKVFYMVRDPRGTMQSRKHQYWCPGHRDCDDPLRLCSDLISDFSAAKRLIRKYPNRFRVIRYEDLAKDPYALSEKLFYFLGYQLHPSIVKFLNTHTKSTHSHIFNTYRITKSVPYHWREDLTFDEVFRIQDACKQAMKLWGYKLALNQTDQLTFDPIVPEYEFSSF